MDYEIVCPIHEVLLSEAADIPPMKCPKCIEDLNKENNTMKNDFINSITSAVIVRDVNDWWWEMKIEANEVPAGIDFIFTAKSFDDSNDMYFGTCGEWVNAFMKSDNGNGFGGHVFTVRMAETNELVDLKGPWTGRPAVYMAGGFAPYMEVCVINKSRTIYGVTQVGIDQIIAKFDLPFHTEVGPTSVGSDEDSLILVPNDPNQEKVKLDDEEYFSFSGIPDLGVPTSNHTIRDYHPVELAELNEAELNIINKKEKKNMKCCAITKKGESCRGFKVTEIQVMVNNGKAIHPDCYIEGNMIGWHYEDLAFCYSHQGKLNKGSQLEILPPRQLVLPEMTAASHAPVAQVPNQEKQSSKDIKCGACKGYHRNKNLVKICYAQKHAK